MTGGARLASVLAAFASASLVATVFAHIWFASTPLPFGGPNIVLAVAASVTAVCVWIVQIASAARVHGGLGDTRRLLAARADPAMWAFGVAVLLWAWVLAVYLRTGTFNDMRMGQLTVGVGVLFAMLMCVDSPRRAKGLIAALVVATAVSALLGIAVLVIGEPFLGLWLRVATVSQTDLETILIFGRSAGGAVHPSTLGYQMAVAIPLGFAALVFGVFRRGRWRVLTQVALFLLLTAMIATLLVNASRSTTLGVGVGLGVCAVGAVIGPAWRRRAGRLVVVAALAAAAQVALFNPWFSLGDMVAELRTVRVHAGDVDGLHAGASALSSDDPRVLGHRFEGRVPLAAYEVQLRQRYGRGYGQPSQVAVTADADGGFVVTWSQAAGRRIERHEMRLRQPGDPAQSAWSRWEVFAPALRGRGAALARHELAVGNVALESDDHAVVGVEVRDLAPGQAYVIQLRTVLPDAPLSEAAGVSGADGRLVFRWRKVVPMVAYECRLKPAAQAQWPAWRACVPSLPRAPVWAGLQAGSGTLGFSLAAGDERRGHQFDGFRSWKWYLAQVRETFAPGVARAARHGEVTVKPDLRGSFVLTWPAPAAPEGVAGYEFRSREIGESRWLPWRAFKPSLSSRAPVLDALSAGWSVVRAEGLVRHTLLGLPPTLEHAAQLRARTPHGVGGESATVGVLVDANRRGVLAWRLPPGDAQVTGYQFRLWWVANKRWRPWQDLTPPFAHGRTAANMLAAAGDPDQVLAAARNAQGVAGALRAQPRTLSTDDLSARSRFPQGSLALRYALDHPFGGGEYRPLRTQAADSLSTALLEEVLRQPPHNQFLHVLVLFGWPGLTLQVAFYGLLAWAAWRAGRLALRDPYRETRFLVVAVVAAWLAYSVNSLFLPNGPFVQDWGHYFVVGLILGLPRILANARPGGGPDGAAARP